MSPTNQPNYFVHTLLRARHWQHRPEFDLVCDWWRGSSLGDQLLQSVGGRGVCALVGMGGAGKTAIAERFLNELLDNTSKMLGRVKLPSSVFVYSFFEDDKPEKFFQYLQTWLDGSSAPHTQKSPTQLMFDIQQHQGLIILDGLEMVQESGTRTGFGRIFCPSLRELLNHIASGNARDLSVLITSRFPLTDLRDSQPRYFHTIDIEQIGVAAGVALLRERGVGGSDIQLEPIVEHCGRHALTIDLAGGYIKEYGNGNPATPLNLLVDLDKSIAQLQNEADEEIDDGRRNVLQQGIRFAGIAQCYRNAMISSDIAAYLLLERICLFRLGVDCDTIAAVFTGPAARKVAGRELSALSKDQVQTKLDWLVRLHIVERNRSRLPHGNNDKVKHDNYKYSVHPAVRDNFLRGMHKDKANAGHEAVRQGLENSLGDAPYAETNDVNSLNLLEEIIHHTLEAGHVSKALEIFRNRIGFENLAHRFGGFDRGARICRYFIGSVPSHGASILSPEKARQIVDEHSIHLRKLSTEEVSLVFRSASFFLNDSGDFQGSVNCQKWAVSLSPGNAMNRQTLAARLFKIGFLKPSREILQELATSKGGSIEDSADNYQLLIWTNLADVLDHSGQVRVANNHYRALFLRARLFAHTIGHHISRVELSYVDFLESLSRRKTANSILKELEADKNCTKCEALLAHNNAWAELESNAFAAARKFATQYSEWATEHGGAIPYLLLARIDLRESRANEDSRQLQQKAAMLLEGGIRYARNQGLGIYHINLLLERARLHLLRGDPIAALEDIEVALDTGIPANEETGQVELLCANHAECGYAWPVPEGLQLRAEALLLQAAQQLGSHSFAPARIKKLPADVTLMINQAKYYLYEAIELWQPLHDPEPERPDQNFQLDGKDYNYRARETHQVLVNLDAGQLVGNQCRLFPSDSTYIESSQVELDALDPNKSDTQSWRKPEYSPSVSRPPWEWSILDYGFYQLREPRTGLGGFRNGLFHNSAGTPFDPQPGVIWTVEEYAAKKEVYARIGHDFLPGLIKGSPACESYLISIQNQAALGDAETFLDVLAGQSVRQTAKVDLRIAYNSLILSCDEVGGDRKESLLKLRALVCRAHQLDIADVAQMPLPQFVRLLTETKNKHMPPRSRADNMRTQLIDSDKVSLRLESEHDEEPVADVIFIHGLGGGSQTTWAFEQKPENFWPLWIAEEFPNLGVWTMGYGSSISAWQRDSMPLDDLGGTILESMLDAELGRRPIVFITHSMGGLVAKKLIDHALSQDVERWEQIVKQVRGVSFIATPHAGAQLANFAKFLGIVLSASEQAQDLERHSRQLDTLHTSFLKAVREQGIICRSFAERQKVKAGIKVPFFNVRIPAGPGLLVVDPTSAEPRIPREKAIALEEDHLSICKPINKESQIHKSICRFLRECIPAIQNP